MSHGADNGLGECQADSPVRAQASCSAVASLGANHPRFAHPLQRPRRASQEQKKGIYLFCVQIKPFMLIMVYLYGCLSFSFSSFGVGYLESVLPGSTGAVYPCNPGGGERRGGRLATKRHLCLCLPRDEATHVPNCDEDFAGVRAGSNKGGRARISGGV